MIAPVLMAGATAVMPELSMNRADAQTTKRNTEELIKRIPTMKDADVVSLLNADDYYVREAAEQTLMTRAAESISKNGRDPAWLGEGRTYEQRLAKLLGDRVPSSEMSKRLETIHRRMEKARRESMLVGTSCDVDADVSVGELLAKCRDIAGVSVDFYGESHERKNDMTKGGKRTLWEHIVKTRFKDGKRFEPYRVRAECVDLKLTDDKNLCYATDGAVVGEWDMQRGGFRVYVEPKCEMYGWNVLSATEKKFDGSTEKRENFISGSGSVLVSPYLLHAFPESELHVEVAVMCTRMLKYDVSPDQLGVLAANHRFDVRLDERPDEAGNYQFRVAYPNFNLQGRERLIRVCGKDEKGGTIPVPSISQDAFHIDFGFAKKRPAQITLYVPEDPISMQGEGVKRTLVFKKER